jgi:hypothetical protein
MSVRAWTKFCTLALLAGAAMVMATPVFAFEEINDPKAWCGKLTDTIASGDMDAAARMFEEGSRGGIQPESAGVSLGTIGGFIKSGPLTSKSFLTETNYGDAFQREWYMIVVGFAPVFIRCSFIKYDASWQFTTIDFDSKADNVGLH